MRLHQKTFPVDSRGFTLIEMIGVLAIIAILIAAISPRIFDAISDSRITNCASLIKTVQTAVSKYYADVGTLYPLNNAGNPAANNNGVNLPNILTGATAVPNPATGLWSRVNSPYLEKFASTNPPIGTAMNMPAVAAVAGAVNANNHTNYDLNGDGTGDMSAGGQVVTLRITGVTIKDFTKLDNILDEGIGSTAAEKQARGKVKWVTAGGGTMRVYIADK
jgi:prepilin-type N-terminal cleavage/methylation domain-containing protein